MIAKCCHAAVAALFALATPLIAGTLQGSSIPTERPGVADGYIGDHLSTADRGTVMLLESRGIVNDPHWQDQFPRQVFGYGVRTEEVALAGADVSLVAHLLLADSSWTPGRKECTIHGDAAIVLSGPRGQVTVMLELWCARAWLRSDTILECHQVHGNVDRVNEQLRGLVRRYFPGDAYLRDIERK